jgi:hypothetical protein
MRAARAINTFFRALAQPAVAAPGLSGFLASHQITSTSFLALGDGTAPR